MNAISGPYGERTRVAGFSLAALSPCSSPNFHQQLQAHDAGGRQEEGRQDGKRLPGSGAAPGLRPKALGAEATEGGFTLSIGLKIIRLYVQQQ